MNTQRTNVLHETINTTAGLWLDFLSRMESGEGELHSMAVAYRSQPLLEVHYKPYHGDIPHVMHSFTKCFTNTAVGAAYTEGILDLDTKVLAILPEFADNANEFLSALTVRNLLTMRSGQARGIGGNEWRPLQSSWLEAYFRVPWVEAPGSRFVYSSGNSYVLSAIIQRVTGRTCYEYLRGTLLDEIGVPPFSWQLSPEGICSGGNGISLRVSDMMRLGQLYLNRGRWQGKQLLSERWVELALGLREPLAPTGGEGQYNFHFTQTDGIWRSTGMFGQECILVPDLELVIAVTAADEHGALFRLLKECVIQPLRNNQTGEAGQEGRLLDKIAAATLESSAKSAPGPHPFKDGDQRIYRADGSVDGITSLGVSFSQNTVSFTQRDSRGRHRIVCGLDHWRQGETSMTGGNLHHQYEMDRLLVDACAYWSAQNALRMIWRYPEMAFCDQVELNFPHDNTIEMQRSVNMNSEARSRPLLTATQERKGENQ